MTDRERSTLRDSLIATLAYFDLADFPLTLLELARLRYRTDRAAAAYRVPLSEVAEALAAAGVECRDGHYFLPGRQAIVETRKRRYRLAEAKFARAAAVARFARLLPSVRLVAVCNSLAHANAEKESDIDLFVVTRPGTAWATRFLIVSALAALGLRPDERTHEDRVCMSFFVTERAMDLSDLAEGDDVYLRYWIATLTPVYDAGGVFAAFLEANRWIGDRLPFALDPDAAPRRLVGGAPRWTAPLGPVLSLLEAPAKAVQRRMFPKEIAAMAAEGGSRVVVNDEVLKFHVNDRRAEFARRFRERLASLGTRAAAPSDAPGRVRIASV